MKSPKPDTPSAICQAALEFASRGWPVFPCSPRDKRPLLPKDKDAEGRPIKGSGGLTKAVTDPDQIRAWWRKWPHALVAIATGHPTNDLGGLRLFVVDFDPRVDPESGEVWTLERLKGETEAQIACALPPTRAALTPSDGVHLYLLQGDDGPAITNRGNLPRHVDVRGLGGYVIAPPSVMGKDAIKGQGGLRYRWLRGDGDAPMALAPAALIETLRAKPSKSVPSSEENVAGDQPASASNSPAADPTASAAGPTASAADPTASAAGPTASAAGGWRPSDDPAEAAIHKYGLTALDEQCRELAATPIGGGRWGGRNRGIYHAALKLGGLVNSTPIAALSEATIRAALGAVVRGMPHNDDLAGALQTLENGLADGIGSPNDLSHVAEGARDRAARYGRSSRGGASGSRPRPPRDDDRDRPTSQTGENRGDVAKDGVWGESWGGPEGLGGGRADDKGRGGAASRSDRESGGGSDGGDDEGLGEHALARRCAFFPQTDLGNLQRFLARFGADFLYVEAWGWLAWDGRRWNRDMAVPLLGHAVQDTMRAIQAEAELVRRSGVPAPDPLPDFQLDDDSASEQSEAARRKAWLRQKKVSGIVPDHGGERLDAIVQVKSNGDIVLLSDKIATWGRTSESAGHIGCIPKMAEARLAARTEDFDADPLLLNVENGTLVFMRPEAGESAAVRRREHRREDRNTKIANVAFDPAAPCEKFDAFFEEVQPDPDMRDFLDAWAGYNSLGLADAQKMAVFYGTGSNGKGVWINTMAHILGDYAWAAAIETFIDQGKYRKGSDASPDLAALAGRRMVYANEPEEGSKFSDGLVKAMTSDEPIGGVRELMKAPFQLLVTFTNTISANNRPKIGTDHGIQRRMQLVPWDQTIPDERADAQLKTKLKAEASGILNRMIRGAISYLDHGLCQPEAVREATKEYLAENDILGMFLALVVEKAPGETIPATPFHRIFAAWQTWANQLPASGKPWSAKHLNAQMQRKGYRILKSSTMQWQDIATRYDEADFVDHEGRARSDELPPPKGSRSADAGRSPDPDDDFVPGFDG